MINISPHQLIDLWVQLEDAYNGVNGYGGTVAEIYAYTVEPSNPGYKHREGMFDEDFELNASRSLYSVLRLFKWKRNCIIYIEDVKGKKRLGKWFLKRRFQHRIHIR